MMEANTCDVCNLFWDSKKSSTLLQHPSIQTRPHTHPLHIWPSADTSTSITDPYTPLQVTNYSVNDNNPQ